MTTSFSWRRFMLFAVVISLGATYTPALGADTKVYLPGLTVAVDNAVVAVPPTGTGPEDTVAAKSAEQLNVFITAEPGLVTVALQADFVANQAALSRLYLVLCRWRAWIVATYPGMNHWDIFNLSLVYYLQNRVPATFAKILYVPFTYNTGCYGPSGWSCSLGCSSCCPISVGGLPHYWAPLHYYWQHYYPIWGNTGVPFAYAYLGMVARLGLVYPHCFASNYWSYFLTCTVTDTPPVLALPNAVAIPLAQ